MFVPFLGTYFIVFSADIVSLLADECKDKEKSGCSQGCLNTAGSYVCSCHYGYSLANDNKTCNGK